MIGISNDVIAAVKAAHFAILSLTFIVRNV